MGGEAQTTVAKKHAVSRSAVSQLVKRMWEAEVPEGFVALTLTVPESLRDTLERYSALAVKDKGKTCGRELLKSLQDSMQDS